MTETTPEGIVNPPIDQLLEHVDSKYRLVLFAAKRARQINAYYSQLAEGLLENVGPLVETTNQEKPLSIAMREIQAGVVEATRWMPRRSPPRPPRPKRPRLLSWMTPSLTSLIRAPDLRPA